jgi:NMD protein affecting ribosome stability and mRNA decay
MVGERPSNWVKEVPTSTCEHCGMVVKGNQWTFRQHQQTKRYLANRDKAA